MCTKPLARFALLALLAACAAPAAAQSRASDSNDEMYERYLREARAMPRPGEGGRSWGWMDGLAFDRRARSTNDVVTIRVVESITGIGTADSALAKDSSASAAVPKLFGLESKLPNVIDPTALASAKSSTDFRGSGTTTRAGELNALMSARVSEVLPNGDLVVEGVREIEINGDRQIVVLTGVVRQADINPLNVVLSTSIGQLRIRYFGRGLMRDNLKPGWLVRVLNKVF